MARTVRSSEQWQSLIAQFEQSNQTPTEFMTLHGLTHSSFYKWRKRFGDENLNFTTQAPCASTSQAPLPSPFIHLGDVPMAPTTSSLNIRLDLGCGLVLHITRG
jgi:hypothetical protein